MKSKDSQSACNDEQKTYKEDSDECKHHYSFALFRSLLCLQVPNLALVYCDCRIQLRLIHISNCYHQCRTFWTYSLFSLFRKPIELFDIV